MIGESEQKKGRLPSGEGFGTPVNYPYLMGLYLVLNTVSDLALFIDGPDCVTFKGEFIFGRHDLNSTLLSCGGRARIWHPCTDVTNIVRDRTGDIAAMLHEADASDHTGGILLTAMPMATLTGVQYDMILRNITPPLRKPVYEVPALSMTGKDWLDGYGATLDALASRMDISGGTPSPDKVAIVGYMMDRNEYDHRANLAELRRMLSALSLETVSIWPEGGSLSRLADVKDAGTIISLPHGRAAARTLSRRTGANLVETGIPFGIGPSCDWLRAVAAATGRAHLASPFIDGELSMIIPRLKWLVSRQFNSLNVIFAGDPLYFESADEFLSELGCRVTLLAGIGDEHHIPHLPRRLVRDTLKCHFNITTNDMTALFAQNSPAGGSTLLIVPDLFDGVANIHSDKRMVLMTFGFTSYKYHAVADSPFLGLRGALQFADRMANALLDSYRQRL